MKKDKKKKETKNYNNKKYQKNKIEGCHSRGLLTFLHCGGGEVLTAKSSSKINKKDKKETKKIKIQKDKKKTKRQKENKMKKRQKIQKENKHCVRGEVLTAKRSSKKTQKKDRGREGVLTAESSSAAKSSRPHTSAGQATEL